MIKSGKFTYQNLKSPTFTYYIGDEGESYGREMSSIMSELKTQYRQKNQQNNKTITRDFGAERK